ncbi:MAG: DUF2905 domain-containing protein [Rhodocyclaceae bacterium]|nr:DUF2905 domain-containing protein [Rhodocyclaceae bacterium]MCB1892730.1 DUF2905 domain-containing protein [Rhodocyclaceae bacterium]MCW5596891.1 DUF2905 domain-containing protein [Rhodocyclaceae bacterium]
MLKWLIVLLITVFVAGIFLPRLAALLRIGRWPGDISFRYRGRQYNFPFGTTVLLSLLATLLFRLI